MLIDCDDCAMRYRACGDCVVTVLLAAPVVPAEATPAHARGVEVDEHERRALDVLADSGLVPRLRLVPIGLPGGVPRTAAS